MLQEHQNGASPHKSDHLISHVRTEGVGELGWEEPRGEKALGVRGSGAGAPEQGGTKPGERSGLVPRTMESFTLLSFQTRAGPLDNVKGGQAGPSLEGDRETAGVAQKQQS